MLVNLIFNPLVAGTGINGDIAFIDTLIKDRIGSDDFFGIVIDFQIHIVSLLNRTGDKIILHHDSGLQVFTGLSCYSRHEIQLFQNIGSVLKISIDMKDGIHGIRNYEFLYFIAFLVRYFNGIRFRASDYFGNNFFHSAHVQRDLCFSLRKALTALEHLDFDTLIPRQAGDVEHLHIRVNELDPWC